MHFSFALTKEVNPIEIAEKYLFSQVPVSEEEKRQFVREHLSYEQKRTIEGLDPRLPKIVAELIQRGVNANELVRPTMVEKELADRKAWEILVPDVFAQNVIAWEMLKKHKAGDVYIHKLPDSALLPYCVGHDFSKVLKKGLRYIGDHWSRPAKKFHKAVQHAVEFLIAYQGHTTGANAFGSLETWLAPFVRNEKLDYEEIKDGMETLYYELNHPWRTGGQAPFTNNTVLLWSSKVQMEERFAIIGGKELGEPLGSYEEEAVKILTAMFELEKEGDPNGAPFTFPIQNVMFSKEFLKNLERYPELFENFFVAAGKMGAQYFENAMEGTKNALGEDAWIDPNATLAMCCRLLVEKTKVEAHGVFDVGDETGSKGIVTINLPRLAMESKQDLQTMLEKLEEEMRRVAEFLVWWHFWYIWLRWKGAPKLFEFANEYQSLKDFERNFWLTFGAVGMPEMANILADEPVEVWLSNDIKAQERLVRDYIKPVIKRMAEIARELSIEYTEKYYGYTPESTNSAPIKFNVEEVPAETAGAKLYLADLRKYDGKIKKYVNTEATMYSNTIYPYYGRAPILAKAKMEGMVQRDFTGGVMHHFWLGERIEDADAVKKLVLAIMKQGVINFSLSPLIVDAKGRKWTRIVGWMRPVDNFNDFRKNEFKTRFFSTDNGLIRYDPWHNYKVIEVDPSIDPFAKIL